MFMRLRKDIPLRVEAWGYSRALTSEEQTRMREALRFIHGYYCALLTLLMVVICVIVYLLLVSG